MAATKPKSTGRDNDQAVYRYEVVDDFRPIALFVEAEDARSFIDECGSADMKIREHI